MVGIRLSLYKRITGQPSGHPHQSEVLDWNGFKSVQRAFIEAGVPDIELPTDIAICRFAPSGR